MTSPFFITGLPRSRTRWFSWYFTRYEGVYCYHELLNWCHTKEDFYDEMVGYGDGGSAIIGNSDSALVITDFQEKFPDAPTLIIERPLEDVRQSLINTGSPHFVPFGEEAYNALAECRLRLSRLTGLRVPYNEINSRLREIHEYLVPGVPYDVEWAAHAVGENVQMPLSDLDTKMNPEAYNVWLTEEDTE